MKSFSKLLLSSRSFSAAVTFMLVATVMTIYEALKQALFGHLSLWGSHLITILFTSCISALVVWGFSERIKYYLSKEKEIELREERIAIHQATMGGTMHYLNNILAMLELLAYKTKKLEQFEPDLFDEIEKRVFSIQEEIKGMSEISNPTKKDIEAYLKLRLNQD